MEVETAPNDSTDEHTHKKARHRKKQIFISIRNQMEFYFGDSNLSKDRFLGQLLREKPYIGLDVFLSFNKISKLTTSIEDLRTALKHSTLIQLSEDGNSVCRKEPFKVKANIDECTIYVERLKPDATHDWLASVFSEFGKVVYVSIPRYTPSRSIKGFAFIEFENEKEAQAAVTYFESIGSKIPSTVDPQEMCSIKSFGDDNTKQENDSSITEEKDETDDNKKRKLDESTEDVCNNKKLKTDEGESEANEISETDAESENKKKKKLKKEHKKKNYIKELGLQILSKLEWKKMRNRYLNMQHKKMKEFKQHLLKARFSQQNYDEKTKKPAENVEIPEESTSTKLDFTEGVIVKIEFPEPFQDPKKLKNEIKTASSDVKFVDLTAPSCEEVIVRFGSNKGAKDFCSSDFNGTKNLLEGDDEKFYWEKILEDRNTKFKKTAKKQRGRDKLLKKANKLMATHIVFDE